ncbi:MAG: hypothetical protein AAGH64_03125 [Planctomycetota bacterium]
MSISRLASFLAIFTILGIALVLAQPSLTPPAGPIAESGRYGTLIEVNDDTAPGNGSFRHVISQPGSYILVSNIDTGTSNGILIDSDNVTLDLNGYTLEGSGEKGIAVPVEGGLGRSFEGITVRDGRIVGYDTGIRGFEFNTNFLTNNFTSTLFSGLDIRATDVGIVFDFGIVERCNVVSGRLGIDCFGSTVTDTVVRVNAEAGVAATAFRAVRSVIRTCHAITFVDGTGGGIGFDLSRTLVTGSRADVSQTGFSLNTGDIATGCLSNASTNFVSATSQTTDSNF